MRWCCLLLFACEGTFEARVPQEPRALKDAACEAPSPLPVHRLTRTEYFNRIAELFPTLDVGQLYLPTDPVRGLFDNDAELLLSNGALVSAYQINARIITEAEPIDARALAQQLGVADFAPYEALGELAAEALLQSPELLLHTDNGVAQRMAAFLWQDVPDAEALGSDLSTVEARQVQATRMLASPKARRQFIAIARQWLDLEFTRDLEPELKAALHEEGERFLDSLFDGTLRDLLESRETFVNARLAQHYGLPAVSDWTRVQHGRGLLTQASFLVPRAHGDQPAPVLRGVFIAKRLMCQALGAPPPSANTVPPEVEARTNREAYEQRTQSDAACGSCHSIINAYGFPFESYGADGLPRSTDNGFPINTRVTLPDGTDIADASALIDYLSSSQRVAECVATQFVTYASKGGSPCLKDVRFGSFKELLVSIAGRMQ